jgi:putative ABC transport system substrate-binding protein
MRRREFFGVLAGAAAWPLVARAQETGRIYRLGFLMPVARNDPAVIAFFDELRANGFIEGKNLQFVAGGFEVRNEQIDELVPTLVNAAPDAILSGGDLTTRALQKATRTIPLFGMTEDMVAAGLVTSLARPGGNTTGISLMSPELDGKRQDFLIEAVLAPVRLLH